MEQACNIKVRDSCASVYKHIIKGILVNLVSTEPDESEVQFWLLYVVVVCGSLDHSSSRGLCTLHSLSGGLQRFIALAELFVHVPQQGYSCFTCNTLCTGEL